MDYFRLRATLNQLDAIVQKLRVRANSLLDDHIKESKKPDQEKDGKKLEDMQRDYLTLHYYIMILSQMEKSIRAFNWFYSSETLIKQLSLPTDKLITPENLEEVIKNIALNFVKFENNRIKYVANFVSNRLLPVLIVAAIPLAIIFSINLTAPAAAPLAVVVVAKIFFFVCSSLALIAAAMGYSMAFCIALINIQDLHQTTKNICELYNNTQSTQNIKFTVTQYLTKTARFDFPAFCCDYSTEYSNLTETGYEIQLPDPPRDPKLYNKCIAICQISDIKGNFFEKKDLNGKKLSQHTELKPGFFWALPQIRAQFNRFMIDHSRCKCAVTNQEKVGLNP